MYDNIIRNIKLVEGDQHIVPRKVFLRPLYIFLIIHITYLELEVCTT